ncbi:MAG: SDR family oxidoreductase, partial [Actinomycetota bacterium]
PHLAVNGGGSIVAISSIAGPVTHRFMTPYDVSKAGLEMLVRQTADELGCRNIRANAVRPGLVPTDATEGLMSMEAIVEDYLQQMPLGRVGTTEDVGRLVRFLLGPESSWITGTCISIDGGHHLRRGPNIEPAMEMVLGDARYPSGPS